MTRAHPRHVLIALLTAASAFAQRAPIAQQLTFSPYHASGVYEVGETVGWTVTPGPEAPTYAYRWTNRVYAVGAAVAPTRIGLSTPRPNDFDAFSSAKLEAQTKIPINASLTPVQTDVPDVEHRKSRCP